MSSSDSYPSDDNSVTTSRNHPMKPAELLSSARQQVDALAPSLDLSTAFLARYPWNHGPNLVKHTSVAMLASARASMTRPITDREAAAVIRATRAKVSAEGQAHWLSVVLAGALWVRGIKTCRFPFWTPKTPPFGGGPLTQTMRMVAYSMVCMFAMRPVEQAIGAAAAMPTVKEDREVMDGLMKAVMEGRRNMHGQQMGGMAMQGLPGQQQQQSQEQSSTYTTRWPSDDSPQSQQQSSGSYASRWPEDPSTQYNPEQNQSSYQSPTTTEQQPSDRWASSPIIDDASPIASDEPSSQQQPASTSWARLRQQARANNPQQQQRQGSWQQVQKTG